LETPELNYQEHRSSAEHLSMLRKQGFRIATGLAGLPTAVMGEAGTGGPVIAFLGEFDALPELSQEAGATEHRPLAGNGPGMAAATTSSAPAQCLPQRRSRTGWRPTICQGACATTLPC
jgi:hypothetical protein